MTCQENNDVALLDAVKAGFELRTDAELAGLLGITRGALYTVRHKTGRLGPKAKLVVLDKIGFLGIRNWVERLTADYISRRLHEMSVNQARSIAKKNIPVDNDHVAELSLPDEIRKALNIYSDESLAKFLGVNRNTISMVRTGKSRFGIGPKLRILQELDEINPDQVAEILADPDMLIQAIRDIKLNLS